jgi:orotate phosphoribosyltransferase
VKKIITIVDRLAEATENFKREGIEFEAIFTAQELLGSK